MILLFKRLICFTTIILSSIPMFSQGGWNLEYISSASLNSSFIGKEIRIDFKASYFDSLSKEPDVFNIRRLLAKEDTVSLTINNEVMQFVEQWRIYVDHGVLNEQYLEAVNYRNAIRIKQIFLESINDDSLIVQVWITGIETLKQSLTVKKSIIKGLLVKTE